MSKFNKLSRAEMRNVLGGYMQVTCKFSGTCDSYGDAPVEYDSSNTTVATIQQTINDEICMALGPCCTNVDCPGAV